MRVEDKFCQVEHKTGDVGDKKDQDWKRYNKNFIKDHCGEGEMIWRITERQYWNFPRISDQRVNWVVLRIYIWNYHQEMRTKSTKLFGFIWINSKKSIRTVLQPLQTDIFSPLFGTSAFGKQMFLKINIASITIVFFVFAFFCNFKYTSVFLFCCW